MTQREALMKAYMSNLITWEDFQAFSRDPQIDIRKEIFESLGIYSRISSGNWTISTGYPTFRSLASDMDIIAKDEANYRELIDHLKQNGYDVKPQLSNTGEEILHTVEQLDLALWPPQSMMPVRKLHAEVTNSPDETGIFEQFPMLKAMGELAKFKLYSPEQLSKLSDSELFSYFRSSVAKPLYKFFEAIEEVSPNHWVTGHPKSFPPPELIQTYRQMVANEIPPLEVLGIRNTSIPSAQHAKEIRRAMEDAILRHQKEVARYIFPYMSPMVENATQANIRAAAKCLKNNPYSSLRDFLKNAPSAFGTHQESFRAFINQHSLNLSSNFTKLLEALQSSSTTTPESLQNLINQHMGKQAPEIIDHVQKNVLVTALKQQYGSAYFNTILDNELFISLIRQTQQQLQTQLAELGTAIDYDQLTPKITINLIDLVTTYDPDKEINPHLWNGARHRRELLEIRYNDMLELLYGFTPGSRKQFPEGVPEINFNAYDASLMALLSPPKRLRPISETKMAPSNTHDLNDRMYKIMFDLLQNKSPNFTNDWGLERPFFSHSRELYRLQSKVQSILSGGNSLKHQLDELKGNLTLSESEKIIQMDNIKQELYATLNRITQNQALQELTTSSTDSLMMQAGQEALQNTLQRMREQLAIKPYEVWTKWDPQGWFNEFHHLKKQLSQLNDASPITQAIALTSLQHPSRQDAIRQTLIEAGISPENPHFGEKMLELEAFLNAEMLTALKVDPHTSPERKHGILTSLLALKNVDYPPGLTKAVHEFLAPLLNDPATSKALKIHIGMLLRTHPQLTPPAPASPEDV